MSLAKQEDGSQEPEVRAKSAPMRRLGAGISDAVFSANFDTRRKIITIDEARAIAGDRHRSGSPPAAFVTHLEVLRAVHVRKLEELAAATSGKLFLILTDPEAPLAPLDARAEVAAALRVVDYVVPSPKGSAPALEAIHPGLIIRDEEEDRGRTRQLIEHVRSRARV